jgi:hypothetical protein
LGSSKAFDETKIKKINNEVYSLGGWGLGRRCLNLSLLDTTTTAATTVATVVVMMAALMGFADLEGFTV